MTVRERIVKLIAAGKTRRQALDEFSIDQRKSISTVLSAMGREGLLPDAWVAEARAWQPRAVKPAEVAKPTEKRAYLRSQKFPVVMRGGQPFVEIQPGLFMPCPAVRSA
jgi:hypothetical protein